jgi:hypothetical protein
MEGGELLTVYEAIMLALTFGLVLIGLLAVVIELVKNLKK